LSENVIVTLADPLPVAPLGTVSHDAFGVAVHGQNACVVIVAVTLPLGMHGLTSTGATEYWQLPVSPDCLTVNRRSATEIAALRSVTSPFRATVYDTLALPEPWPPAVIVSHDALLLAVQGQLAAALTMNVPLPASFPKSALPGDTS
jgi:hypothetical protein